MKLIAVDLGSHMALAHNGFDDVVITDYRHFEGIRAHRAGATLDWLDSRLAEIAASCGPLDGIVYERPFARGMDATRCLWGIAGLIEALASTPRHNLAVIDLENQGIKRWAIGHSNTKRGRLKEGDSNPMLDAATRLGYKGSNDHEADAFCLLKYALLTAAVTEPKVKRGASKTK